MSFPARVRRGFSCGTRGVKEVIVAMLPQVALQKTEQYIEVTAAEDASPRGSREHSTRVPSAAWEKQVCEA